MRTVIELQNLINFLEGNVKELNAIPYEEINRKHQSLTQRYERKVESN
jgi:hypothetical protein